MKKKQIIALIVLVFFLISFTLVEEFQLLKSEDEMTFSKTSSYISAKNQIFIYQVSDTAWAKIEEHGKNLEHESGGLTASFYYLKDARLPDLSSSKNYIDAIDKGQTSECVAIYWLNGKSKFTKFPFKPRED